MWFIFNLKKYQPFLAGVRIFSEEGGTAAYIDLHQWWI
jgi:hypothetical protein